MKVMYKGIDNWNTVIVSNFERFPSKEEILDKVTSEAKKLHPDKEFDIDIIELINSSALSKRGPMIYRTTIVFSIENNSF